jgi:TRAP-type C4-dicarboxylate transport system permease small subunit
MVQTGDGLMRVIGSLASLLVIPLVLMLFIQWPLREWVQAYARQANDIGQIFFALYVAVAITAASLSQSHLAVGTHNHPQPPNKHALWRACAVLVCVVPWALFMLWACFPILRVSVLEFERFPEALTPGYFVIKIALALLLLLVLWHAICGVFSKLRRFR